MELALAKELLTALADGIDPFTGEVFPRDHVCNQPDTIRALHCVLQALPAERKKDTPPNAGQPWSQKETVSLQAEFQMGKTTSEMARIHGRSRGSIEAKLANLGLIERSYFPGKREQK